MRADHLSENGFTLVELLVALVVASFLLVILFDGLAGSTSRSNKMALQQTALSIAKERLKPTSAEGSGAIGKINWKAEDEIIARDTRGTLALVKRKVIVGTEQKAELVTLQKRFIKKVAP